MQHFCDSRCRSDESKHLLSIPNLMSPYLLFIEDDEMTAYLTLRALKINSFAADVVRANNGADALQHFRSGKPKPTLILLDLKLPKVSGMEVLKILRSISELQFVPVVVLTVSNLEHNRQKTAQLGIAKYIVKPADFDELVAEMDYVKHFFDILADLNSTK